MRKRIIDIGGVHVLKQKENDISIYARGVFASLPNVFTEEIKEMSSVGRRIDFKVVGEQNVTYKKWLFHRSKLDVSKCKFNATYIMLSAEGDVLYVGKAKDISERVSSHLHYQTECNLFMDYVHSIILVKDAAKYEEFYIDKLQPIFNTVGVKDQAYKLAKSTLITKYPIHKDAIVRQLILRDRILKGNKKSEIDIYSSETDVEMIMEMMSFLSNEDKMEESFIW
jgi:hypothetical protein